MIDWSEQDMRVSRTELKKAHERLQQLAEPLANLSKKQIKKLPVTEYFVDELTALADISSANARNRQIKRVGKLISEENRHDLVDALFQIRFSPEQAAKVEAWYTRLNINDESTLKQFVKQFSASERNSLYQLLLWIEYAKHMNDDELLAESETDLLSYIKEVAILSQL
ncbi:ribosome biogenesis factor YjgA [Psychrobacter sp. I-STPA6b]|uniref:ribosome biogenesis factor YjgA n=1 Tax=Psychrobacter sp. I-STPA6b TaxID=2585718 RepID=UPI001D0C1318|nr:ribosome biogenesis factor YjgA [Psychrobacter sp. I-STPA6b]